MSFTTKEDYARNEKIKVGMSFIFDKVKDMMNYAYWAKDVAVAVWTGRHYITRTVATATNTATLTTAQMVTAHHIDGTPTSAATYTTPTAAELVAAISGVAVGSSYYLSINNKSSGANTITLAGGSGVTADGTLTVAQNVCRLFLVTFTNVTSGSEAVSIYGIGT